MFDQVDALARCETQIIHLYQSAATAAAAAAAAVRLAGYTTPVILHRYMTYRSSVSPPTDCETTHDALFPMSKPRAAVAADSESVICAQIHQNQINGENSPSACFG